MEREKVVLDLFFFPFCSKCIWKGQDVGERRTWEEEAAALPHGVSEAAGEPWPGWPPASRLQNAAASGLRRRELGAVCIAPGPDLTFCALYW